MTEQWTLGRMCVCVPNTGVYEGSDLAGDANMHKHPNRDSGGAFPIWMTTRRRVEFIPFHKIQMDIGLLPELIDLIIVNLSDPNNVACLLSTCKCLYSERHRYWGYYWPRSRFRCASRGCTPSGDLLVIRFDSTNCWTDTSECHWPHPGYIIYCSMDCYDTHTVSQIATDNRSLVRLDTRHAEWYRIDDTGFTGCQCPVALPDWPSKPVGFTEMLLMDYLS